MTVVSFVNGLNTKVDSLITSKLFMYFIMYSYSKSTFENKKFLGKIPFLAMIFGFVVASVMFVVVSVLSIVEPLIVFLIKKAKGISSKKIKLEITIRAHHIAVISASLFFVFWVAS